MKIWEPAATPACLHTPGGALGLRSPTELLSSGPGASPVELRLPIHTRALRHKFNSIPPLDIHTHTHTHTHTRVVTAVLRRILTP